MLQFAALWLLLSIVSLLFAGSLSLTEIAAAGVCGLLATIWSRCAVDRRAACFSLTPALLRPLLQATAEMPGQTLVVGLRLGNAALRGAGGGSAVVSPSTTFSRFSLADTAPEAKADRAVGILAASLAPRSYVVLLDSEQDIVVTHDLTGRSETGEPA